MGSGTRASGSSADEEAATTSHRQRPVASQRSAANQVSVKRNSGSAYGRVYAEYLTIRGWVARMRTAAGPA